MWPFRRKKEYPSRSEIRPEEAWQVADGTYEGKVIITRFNRAFDALAGHPELPHQVGIAVPFRDPQPTGLPTVAEGAELQELEDELRQAIEVDNESFLVGVITTAGMREFVLYTSDVEGVKARFHEWGQRVTSHEPQIMIQTDPDWSVYRGLTKG